MPVGRTSRHEAAPSGAGNSTKNDLELGGPGARARDRDKTRLRRLRSCDLEPQWPAPEFRQAAEAEQRDGPRRNREANRGDLTDVVAMLTTSVLPDHEQAKNNENNGNRGAVTAVPGHDTQADHHLLEELVKERRTEYENADE